MKQQARHILAGAVLVGLVIVVAFGVYGTDRLALATSEPAGVMGGACQLQAVAPAGKANVAQAALRAGEAALRDIQSRLSPDLEGSEIVRFNNAPAQQVVALSDPAREALDLARQLARDTGGVFDVTAGPILEAWQAASQDRPPTREELEAARAASSWDQIVLGDQGAIKLADTVRVDLGGIAKGCGVDRAVEAMMSAGAAGGCVMVGGDIRCFGRNAQRRPWRVGVRDPFTRDAARPIAVLGLTDGAVCIRESYLGHQTTQGKRFGRVKDPRPGPNLGRSVEGPASVTVVAPTCALADGWASALAVLGPDGLGLLREAGDVKAMMVVGSADNYQVFMSDGMESLLAEPVSRTSGVRAPTIMPADQPTTAPASALQRPATTAPATAPASRPAWALTSDTMGTTPATGPARKIDRMSDSKPAVAPAPTPAAAPGREPS